MMLTSKRLHQVFGCLSIALIFCAAGATFSATMLAGSSPAYAAKYYVQCSTKKTFGRCPANSDTWWTTNASSENEAVSNGNEKSAEGRVNFKDCWKASTNRSQVNACDP